MPVRWSDERIDDLASIVHANDHRLDRIQDMAQTAERDIQDLKRVQDALNTAKRARRTDILAWLAIGAAYAAIVVDIIWPH